MKKKILLLLAVAFIMSCNKNDGSETIKTATGKVWRSGGLMYCAEQIQLDNGKNIIVGEKSITTYTSGDQVKVQYKELAINKYCPPAVDCEIIKIEKVN